jgi:hypothetical protein
VKDGQRRDWDSANTDTATPCRLVDDASFKWMLVASRPTVVAALVLAVVPANSSSADPAPPATAADLLLSSIDPSVPVAEDETNDLLHLNGDSRFASSVDAFVDTVLTEQWVQVDDDGVIPGRTSQDLANLLVETSFGRSDPENCWDDDPPELISVAGEAYQAPHRDGSMGTIVQAVDEFVDADAAQRLVNAVMLDVARQRHDRSSDTHWWIPEYEDRTARFPRTNIGTLHCFPFEEHANSLSQCNSVPSCFADDEYLIASNDRWVIRFDADIQVADSDALESMVRDVLALTAG